MCADGIRDLEQGRKRCQARRRKFLTEGTWVCLWGPGEQLRPPLNASSHPPRGHRSGRFAASCVAGWAGRGGAVSQQLWLSGSGVFPGCWTSSGGSSQCCDWG